MITNLLADPARERKMGDVSHMDLGSLISTLGTSRFSDEFLGFIKQVSGVEYVHFFQMIDNRPHVLRAVSLDASGSAERQADFYLARKLFSVDRWVADWIEGPSDIPVLFHVSHATEQCAEIQNYYEAMQVSDRIMVCGRGGQGILGISLAKSQQDGPLDASRERLEVIRNIALPLFLKHQDYCWQRTELSHQFLDVNKIEKKISQAPENLSYRQVQIAARILRGLTSSGIALDLGIGRETVISYRKRLYEKLMISSYHDLISWYINCIPNTNCESIN